MQIIELILTAFGLSMDAFSVSICKGLSFKKTHTSQALIVALFFGIFQALMPLLGYLIVKFLENSEELKIIIDANAPIIACVLLVFIGGKMLWDAFKGSNKPVSAGLKIHELLLLSIATSIDALMTGFAFAALEVNIVIAITIIGLVTLIMSFTGVYIGHFFGSKWEKPATIVGGCVLILLGIKFLII